MRSSQACVHSDIKRMWLVNRVLATSSTDGLIELIPSMALEKILHDSPFRSINKYLAHYHPDPSGWCYSSLSQSLHILPVARLLRTSHAMVQTCCTPVAYQSRYATNLLDMFPVERLAWCCSVFSCSVS